MGFALTAPKTKTLVRQLNGVLTNHDIAQLLSYIDTQRTSDAMVGSKQGAQIKDEVRRSKVFFLPMDTTTQWPYNKIAKVITDVNQQSFNFALESIQNIQYTEYHATNQGTYTDHLDWAVPAVKPRKLSMSIQLTDGHEYEGGDLEIKPTSAKPILASRCKGDALVFPSFLLHGVTPVTVGTRRSLVVWVEGPEWK